MLNQIDLSRFDLNLLVLFQTVLEERHVARAAARLHVSPSAVSHGLGRLRDALEDPLFIRNPRGVVPTARAEALATRVAEILSRVRDVVETHRFDPATSRRRFMIGAPDALCAIMLTRLLVALRQSAPGIDVGIRHVLPPFADGYSWLDERKIDLALLPVDDVPARFLGRVIHQEKFVLAMRAGNPLAKSPTLKRYCEALHVVMSHQGDPHGNIDRILAARGLERRVVMVVPTFLLALLAVMETDLVFAAVETPIRSLAKRFGLVIAPVPLEIQSDNIRAIVPQSALADAGIAWLIEEVERALKPAEPQPRRRRRA
jgi:DNA-binding transcriptional LysR family regulator